MAIFDVLFGRPLASDEEQGERVGVRSGVPMLGLDALSSAAYGPEAALTILIPLGAAGLGAIRPIGLVIVALLVVVATSYRQTIAAYPNGGGSYTVARENLGPFASLLAAAALMLDYILTVAVGISAGVGAIVSAFPVAHPYTLPLCLAILALITVVNLRGNRESGLAFLAPTYAFLAAMLGLLGWGLFQAIRSGGHPAPVTPPPALEGGAGAGALGAAAGITLGMWLHAFASGCTAMTGVEAVSNGITAFREPRVDNARKTLAAIVVALAAMLLGVAWLCPAYGIGAMDPNKPGYQTVLAQLVAAIAGKGAIYYAALATILAVTALSANTAFADFPRLCRLVAIDGYLPQGFAHRGRRLVFTQGIVALAITAGVLLVAFGGVTDRLIPLYAVGAFLAFTLSQAGMVVHWRKQGGKAAGRSMALNGVGAACTGLTLVVVLVAKFTEGAWLTVLLVPTLIAGFVLVRRHLDAVAVAVRCEDPIEPGELTPPVALLVLRNWSAITRKAARFALTITPDVRALHITSDEDAEETRLLTAKWSELIRGPASGAGHPGAELVVTASPFRQVFGPVMAQIRDLDAAHPGRQIAVIIPELVELKWYHALVDNKTALFLKGFLRYSGLRRVVVVSVPWYAEV